MDVNEYFKILAKNIKKFRKEKGINIRELSKALNVKVSELLKDNINQVL